MHKYFKFYFLSTNNRKKIDFVLPKIDRVNFSHSTIYIVYANEDCRKKTYSSEKNNAFYNKDDTIK